MYLWSHAIAPPRVPVLHSLASWIIWSSPLYFYPVIHSAITLHPVGAVMGTGFGEDTERVRMPILQNLEARQSSRHPCPMLEAKWHRWWMTK